MAKFVIFAVLIVAVILTIYSPVNGSKRKEAEMTMQDGMMMIKGGKKGDMMIIGDDCSPIKFMQKSGKGKKGSMVMIMNKGSGGCCKKEGCKKTIAIPVMMVPEYGGDSYMSGGGSYMGGGGGSYMSGGSSMGGGGYGDSGMSYDDSSNGGGY